MARISSAENGTSTSSRPAWAWRAKASASARPWSCSSRENSGTKAAEKAPSANSRRKKFGSLNATMKASATAPEPSTADSTMSRTKPTTRLSSVKLPTVAMARPRLMLLSFSIVRTAGVPPAMLSERGLVEVRSDAHLMRSHCDLQSASAMSGRRQPRESARPP